LEKSSIKEEIKIYLAFQSPVQILLDQICSLKITDLLVLAENLENKEQLKTYLTKFAIKKIDLTEKQIQFIYLWLKKKIQENFFKLRQIDPLRAENVIKNLSEDPNFWAKIIEKNQNTNRFKVLVKEDLSTYQEKIQIAPSDLYKDRFKDLTNVLTRIHNLFLKPPTLKDLEADSVNAIAVLEFMKIDGNYMEHNDASKRLVFHDLDEGIVPSDKGVYIIQGSSEKMIVNQAQQAILDFNARISAALKNDVRFDVAQTENF